MEYTRYTNSVSMFYMDVDSEFVKAISAEISKRNLGLREAAQVIGTSHPTLGRVLAGDKVSFEFACQVAPFLRLPKEASVRLAGLLPPVPESTAQTEQLVYMFSQLDETDKTNILRMIEVMLDK